VVLCLLAVGFANSSMAVSPDELRELSGMTDREEQQRANRAKSGDVQKLIPQKNDPPSPHSDKYSTQGSSNVDVRNRSTNVVPPPQHDNQYVPPPRGAPAGKDVIFSDSVNATHQFGIRLGQWMEATLDRNSSNAEPGMIELRLSKDVAGDKRTLDAGTLIYASKILNGGTKRLELTTVKGITPDGHEFIVKGQVFDIQKVSGLNGIMVLDKEQIAKHSLTSGALSAVSAAGRAVLPTNPAASALRGATESALTDTDRVTEYNNAQRAVIYVSPQPLLIRIDEKF
jgi:hypothetical protein